MQYAEAMAYINSFSHTGAPVKDLSRITGLLRQLGNPHKQFRFLHIAGTNGKGSTLTYCASVLTAAGYRTGLFTSPYIHCYEDRIRIDGRMIPAAAICQFCEQVRHAAGQQPYSQFEITMAIALLYFQAEHCDFVCLETGIGGLLDATNVVDPLVSILTSISLDHTAILGKTIPEIATQKAGIIKPGRPVVAAADVPEDALTVIRAKAEACGTPLYIADAATIATLEADLTGSTFRWQDVTYRISMPGRHQQINALTALTVLSLLRDQGCALPDAAVHDGLAAVRIGARIEVLQEDPLVLLDGGHNPDGVAALADTLRTLGKPPVFAVIGLVNTKDYQHALSTLAPLLTEAACVDDFAPNAVPGTALAAALPCPCSILPLHEAYAKALRYAKAHHGTALVCGSLYLAAALAAIRAEKPPTLL